MPTRSTAINPGFGRRLIETGFNTTSVAAINRHLLAQGEQLLDIDEKVSNSQ